MNQTKPIKSYRDVQNFKQFYLTRGEYRNHLLISICLNSALRISDVLRLKAENFYDFENKKFNSHLKIREKKTGKSTEIFLNSGIKEAFGLYAKKCGLEKGYLFKNRRGLPLSRVQAYRIIKEGAEYVGIDISCHSLRKTFGYYAWKNGVPPAMLMAIFNHSSYEITKRYLGINQDEKDVVYNEIIL